MKRLKWFGLVIWMILLGLLLQRSSHFTRRYSAAYAAATSPPVLVQLDERLLKVVTFGFLHVYHDYLSMAGIQLLADKSILRESAEAIQKTLLQITRHQPPNEALYCLACFVFIFDFKRPELCQKITLDGLKALPDSWKIPAVQAFAFAYRLNDPQNAGLYYSLAASRSGAPKYFPDLAEKLRRGEMPNTQEAEQILQDLLNPHTGGGLQQLWQNR